MYLWTKMVVGWRKGVLFAQKPRLSRRQVTELSRFWFHIICCTLLPDVSPIIKITFQWNVDLRLPVVMRLAFWLYKEQMPIMNDQTLKIQAKWNLFHYIYFGHACYWQSTKETLMAKEIHQIVRQGTRLFIDIWFILFYVACIFKMHIKPSVCFLHLNPKNVCCVIIN